MSLCQNGIRSWILSSQVLLFWFLFWFWIWRWWTGQIVWFFQLYPWIWIVQRIVRVWKHHTLPFPRFNVICIVSFPLSRHFPSKCALLCGFYQCVLTVRMMTKRISNSKFMVGCRVPPPLHFTPRDKLGWVLVRTQTRLRQAGGQQIQQPNANIEKWRRWLWFHAAFVKNRHDTCVLVVTSHTALSHATNHQNIPLEHALNHFIKAISRTRSRAKQWTQCTLATWRGCSNDCTTTQFFKMTWEMMFCIELLNDLIQRMPISQPKRSGLVYRWKNKWIL